MLKEILLNRGVWVAISFCLFVMCYFAQEAYGSCLALHYALLAAVYISIALYAIGKITAAKKYAAAKIENSILKGGFYGNSN